MKIEAFYNLINRRLKEAGQKLETGLYFHYPFCRSKCSYCHFVSTVYELEHHRKWLAVITEEIQRMAASFSDYIIVDTVYFGGGTPSLITPDEVDWLLNSVEQNFVVKLQETTLEVNPATEAERIKHWLQAGINRLSLGVQSFDPEVLRVLGRTYTPEQAVRLLERARTAGSDNIGLDLMVGVPGESSRTFKLNLEVLAKLRPEHVSVYLLEELEKVPFQNIWAKSPVPEEAAVKSYEKYRLQLEEKGWLQYEIANFSQPGYQCRHNLKYWRYQPFLGLGPAASSHLGSFRWTNPAGLKDWLLAIKSGSSGFEEFLELGTEEEIRECLAFGLRLKEGVSLADLRLRFPGYDWSTYEIKVRQLEASGLLLADGGRVRIPPDKFLVSNSIICELLYS